MSEEKYLIKWDKIVPNKTDKESISFLVDSQKSQLEVYDSYNPSRNHREILKRYGTALWFLGRDKVSFKSLIFISKRLKESNVPIAKRYRKVFCEEITKMKALRKL
jgi:hypothetical protein